MKEALRSSPGKRIGYCFLLEKGTIIRIYRFFHQPYKLPSFLTLRVFALEMMRQRMIVENEHFLSLKNSSKIKFPWAIVPFIIKNKDYLPLVESLLRYLGFPTEVAINYDPHHIISNRRKANKNKPFEHHEVEGLPEAANLED